MSISLLDCANLTDETLIGFDKMMFEANVKVQFFSALATRIWGDVLRELDRRGHVQLVSGSYDEVGGALVTRNYEII